MTIVEMLNEIYSKYSESGGALHIVIDDLNLGNKSLEFCLNESIPQIEDPAERKLFEDTARTLLEMKYRKRRTVLENFHIAYWKSKK